VDPFSSIVLSFFTWGLQASLVAFCTWPWPAFFMAWRQQPLVPDSEGAVLPIAVALFIFSRCGLPSALDGRRLDAGAGQRGGWRAASAGSDFFFCWLLLKLKKSG
jgi:hypothetical protein